MALDDLWSNEKVVFELHRLLVPPFTYNLKQAVSPFSAPVSSSLKWREWVYLIKLWEHFNEEMSVKCLVMQSVSINISSKLFPEFF